MLTSLVLIMILLVAYWAIGGGLDEIGTTAEQTAVITQ